MWNDTSPPGPGPTGLLLGAAGPGGSTAAPYTANWSDDLGNATANATSGLDLEEILEASLGPRHRSLLESVILSIVYGAIFLTGVIGNVCTCIVIAKNSTMHTATNYYLFSLAISDVLTLILALPPELYTIWIAYPWVFGEPFCVFKVFLSEMTSSASVLTITAFTVERYVAICHPIKAQTMSSLGRAIRTIVGIWGCACLSALPYPVHAGTFYFVHYPGTDRPIPDSLQCNIHPDKVGLIRYFLQASTFLLFVLPMTLISVLYILIGLTLRRSTIARRATVSGGHHGGTPPAHSTQARRAVLKMLGARLARTKMRLHQERHTSASGEKKNKRRSRHEVVHAYLVAVVVAFFLCWAPFHAQRLMTTFIPEEMWTAILIEIQSILFYSSGVLYFVSSTVNPILYNLMSRKYRRAFKDTLCRCCGSPEARLTDRSRAFSDRLSNTYVTVAGTSSSSRYLADRSPTRRPPPASTRLQNVLTSPDVKNRTKKEGTNGWGTTWKSRLLSPGVGGKAEGLAVNGQAGLAGGQEVEMTDVAGADDPANHQLIRLKDHVTGATYL